MNRIPEAFAILVLAAAGPVQAAGHPCADVRDAAQRLACYDRAFPPAAGSSGALVDREAQRAQAVRDFGLSGQQIAEQDPERTRELAVGRIEAIIARITQSADGKRVVGLDNGQVWLLTEPSSRGTLRVGDRVAVRDAALGTYMLVTPRGIALRARRTR